MSPGKTNGEKKLAKDHLSLDQHRCRQVDPATSFQNFDLFHEKVCQMLP